MLTRLIEALDNRGDDWLEPIRGAFIGPAPLVIDVAFGEFPRDSSDPRQKAAVSAALSVETARGVLGVCALTGDKTSLHRGNWPQPNLPGLGQSYLYSRNSDIGALKRYDRIAEDSISVGADLVQRLGGVLSKLTEATSKDRTWRLVPAEKGDKPDLVLCSVEEVLPYLVDTDEDEDDAAPTSAEPEQQRQGRAYFQAIKGAADAPTGAMPDVTILVLRTVDPANRKAVYSRRVARSDVERSSDPWQQAMQNWPPHVGFLMPVKGTKGTRLRHPRHQQVLSLIGLTRTKYLRGGRAAALVGTPAADAFGLFLREGDETKRATTMLRDVLHRYEVLILELAALARGDIEKMRKFDPKLTLRRDALRATAWIGALLFYLGRKKETYMSDFAYVLGQFLSAADIVHVGYCADRREGQVPPVLAGASVMSLASGNPSRAFAVLSQRTKPYRDWMGSRRVENLEKRIAQLEKEGEKARAWSIRIARSRARQMEEVSARLDEMLRNFIAAGKKPNDIYKAELMLGYLSGFPKREKAGSPASPDPAHQQNDIYDEGEAA